MTALQPLDIPYGALDTKTDERILPPGALLVAENVSSQKVGVYSKRYGYDTLTGAPGACVRLIKRGDELAVLSGLFIHGYHAAGSARFGSFNGVPPDALTTEATAELDQTQNQSVCSVAVANGMRVDVWLTAAGSPVVQGTSIADGALVFRASPAAIAGVYTTVRACAAGNLVVVAYGNPGTGKIEYSVVDTTAAFPTAGSATLVTNAADAVLAQFDMCPLNSTDVLFAYKTTVPNVSVIRRNVVTSTTSAGPSAVSVEVVDACLAVLGVTSEFGVVLYHSTAAGGMRAALFNPSTTVQTVAPFNVEAVVAPLAVNCGLTRLSATSYLAVWDRAANGITKPYVQWGTISSGGVFGAVPGPLRNVAMASKPFTQTIAGSSLPFVSVWFGGTSQPTFYAVRLTTSASQPWAWPAAMHAYRNAWATAPATNVLSDLATVSSGTYVYAGAIQYKFLSTSAAKAGVSVFGIDLSSAKRWLFCEAENVTLLSGGAGSYYDGHHLHETNFLQYPTITQATPGAVGAAGMDNGTYSYIAIYEFTDRQGNTHRSTTSLAVSATTGAGAGLGKVTLTIDDCTITRLTATTMGLISLFRTTASGTVYRFVGSASLTGNVASVTIVDQANDTTIATNRLLYTTGGVLDREPPLPSTHVCLHKGRVWGISSADKKTVFYSGSVAVGEGAWFSSLQQVRIDAGGDATAVASLDDKLIVFKADRIFKIYGNGPNALGQNSDLSDPILVTGDAGCDDPRSILATDTGLLFKTKKGLYELGRNEQLTYKGEAADAYWSNYTSVVAANMLPDRQEARFEVSGGTGVGDALTGSSIAAQKLVFNYATGQWTTHRNYQDATAVDAIVVGGVYYWATAAGAVYKENTASFLDPSSTYVRSLLRTGWIKPTGSQGFTRVGRAMAWMQRKTDHALTFFVENDYVATTTSTMSRTAAQLAALPQEQIDLHLKQQKGESYGFTIYDGADGTLGTGEGCTFLTLQLLAKAIRGTFEKMLSAGAKG